MSVFSITNVGAKVDIDERGILMSAPMVRVSLDDSKTQTRRVFKPERITFDANGRYSTHALRDGEVVCTGSGPFVPNSWLHYCPYGRPGDRLWVREAWRSLVEFDKHPPRELVETCPLRYEADKACTAPGFTEGFGKYRPPMFMPRWASRITLEITGVRVERLQDISEADAMAEGITCENVVVGSNCNGGIHHEETADRFFFDGCPDEGFDTGIDAYAALWDHINGEGEWDKNPWVWVVEFKRLP